jgi:hypothetical protein
MDSRDNFRERFEALEQRTEQLQQHTRTVERRLRWWQGLACGAVVLALLGFPLQSGKAQYEDKDLAQRVKHLEYKLEYVSGGPNEVVITGANLRIVNGLGDTSTTNGLGNLIVGYNELRPPESCIPPPCINERTGSHNVVVGLAHNFSRFGGLVVGSTNTISGVGASVSGGVGNTASGSFASVSGGEINTASGFAASVSGASGNTASGNYSSVSGGQGNTANGPYASVSGGRGNTASGDYSSVSGGGGNTASGFEASVSGGLGNTASGIDASVSGGQGNTASGDFSSVSGGSNRSAPGTENWAAGPLFATN